MSVDHTHIVLTDLTLTFCPTNDPTSACTLDSQTWHRLDKDLYLHTAQQTAWLYIAHTTEECLTDEDLVLMDISIGDPPPNASTERPWESRPGGIWVLRERFTGGNNQAVTGVDVLFGVDAVDPRQQWTLQQPPLQLDAEPQVPVANLTVRRGKAKVEPHQPQNPLRARGDGKFKIVQISDMHMVTGVGTCKDAIDAEGRPLAEREADPLTVKFLGDILDTEKPDLVVLTGDQLHHDILDSQSALFKVLAPLIERSIPYAAVFGNHDDEGTYALPRSAQMSLYEDMPFSLAQPGPENVAGVGNYYLQVLPHEKSQGAFSTLYFLDSHGQIPSEGHNPDYSPIQPSQIDWFARTAHEVRKGHTNDSNSDRYHLSLAFMHIPFPEYSSSELVLRGGKRREPTEGPRVNSHFYDVLKQENVAAVGCGHDHVNDFCALLPKGGNIEGVPTRLGPWLCYNGGSGFGGYCSYGKNRYHRRTRVWELDSTAGSIKTWKRLEYAKERIDELVLVDGGQVVGPAVEPNAGTGKGVAQVDL